MIKKDVNGLVDHRKLEGIEIEIFKEFLIMERKRHEEDIKNINKTLSELKK